mmetsp:Transcript_12080/g.25942  ORF Transcript_12080/g.25942 Transcript_12080/m.25942 type:complete len:319 (+) Transcript_12080:700-1656(+)
MPVRRCGGFSTAVFQRPRHRAHCLPAALRSAPRAPSLALPATHTAAPGGALASHFTCTPRQAPCHTLRPHTVNQGPSVALKSQSPSLLLPLHGSRSGLYCPSPSFCQGLRVQALTLTFHPTPYSLLRGARRLGLRGLPSWEPAPPAFSASTAAAALAAASSAACIVSVLTRKGLLGIMPRGPPAGLSSEPRGLPSSASSPSRLRIVASRIRLLRGSRGRLVRPVTSSGPLMIISLSVMEAVGLVMRVGMGSLAWEPAAVMRAAMVLMAEPCSPSPTAAGPRLERRLPGAVPSWPWAADTITLAGSWEAERGGERGGEP